MAESLLSQLLMKGQEPDPLANIGQGGYGLQSPQNPIMDAAGVVGEHLTPDYLKNPNVHGLQPNENWKTPRSQPDNPLPWLATDVLTGGGAKAAAPLMKSIFLGPGALAADQKLLSKAVDMFGESLKKIGKETPMGKYPTLYDQALRREGNLAQAETGYWIGPDGKWRFHVPDVAGKYKAPGTNKEVFHPGAMLTKNFRGALNNEEPLESVLKHPELYENHPEMKNYQTGTDLPENWLGSWDFKGRIDLDPTKPVRDTTSNLLHEVQHGAQTIHDFALGTNPTAIKNLIIKHLTDKGAAPANELEHERVSEASRNLYHRYVGENESRAIQRLYEWGIANPQHLDALKVHRTGDIPAAQQIVPYSWLSRQKPEIQEWLKHNPIDYIQNP